MASLTQHAGYFEVDHRESPGIPPDLAARWAALYGTVTAVGSTHLEADTYTCGHCQRVVIKTPDRLRPREVCRRCMHIVCDRCSNPNISCQTFARVRDDVMGGRYVEKYGMLLPR